MKLLPLTTRKQLLNPHRASHQVSKSTHLCMITHADNKWCDARDELNTRLKSKEQLEPKPGHGFCCGYGFVLKNKAVILTCQWSQGLRVSHFYCHNSSCSSTGCTWSRGSAARSTSPGSCPGPRRRWPVWSLNLWGEHTDPAPFWPRCCRATGLYRGCCCWSSRCWARSLSPQSPQNSFNPCAFSKPTKL